MLHVNREVVFSQDAFGCSVLFACAKSTVCFPVLGRSSRTYVTVIARCFLVAPLKKRIKVNNFVQE